MKPRAREVNDKGTPKRKKTQDTEETSTLAISGDPLIVVFGYLQLRHYTKCRLVCRQWRKILDSRYVRIICELDNDDEIESVFSELAHLSGITIHESDTLNFKRMAHLSELSAQRLEVLNILDAMMQISIPLPSFINLQFLKLQFLSKEKFDLDLGCFPRLQSLRLSGPKISKRVFEQAPRLLQSISLRDAVIPAIDLRHLGLHRLTLKNCRAEALEIDVRIPPSIEHLKLKELTELDPRMIISFTQIRNLRSVNLRGLSTDLRPLLPPSVESLTLSDPFWIMNSESPQTFPNLTFLKMDAHGLVPSPFVLDSPKLKTLSFNLILGTLYSGYAIPKKIQILEIRYCEISPIPPNVILMSAYLGRFAKVSRVKFLSDLPPEVRCLHILDRWITELPKAKQSERLILISDGAYKVNSQAGQIMHQCVFESAMLDLVEKKPLLQGIQTMRAHGIVPSDETLEKWRLKHRLHPHAVNCVKKVLQTKT